MKTNELCKNLLLKSTFHCVLKSLIVAFVCATSVEIARAQVMVAGTEPTENNPGQPPFLLPAQPTDIGEAMEDFRRFAGRKQWEKAFKHLEKVFASTSEGLVLTADGIMLPSRMIAREALLELPVPGQDAYRLFFDAEAKKLLDAAQGKEELTKLSQVFSRFLITSVGDSAADRLGDLHFESGNLEQAVHAWRSVIEQRPDTQLSKPRLKMKIAVALARLNRMGEFEDLLKEFEEQHPNEKMTLGGKEVVALEQLKAIAARTKSQPPQIVSASTSSTLSDIPLPINVEPLWQFRFFPTVDPKSGQPQGLPIVNRWWGGPQTSSDWVPPVVIDGTRLYTNFVGYDLGINLEDGKLLWRSGRFFDAIQKSQQGMVSPLEQHGMTMGAGRIWSVERDQSNQNQNQNRNEQAAFGLVSRDPETGKQMFSSFQSTELKPYSVRGTPLIDGDRIFLTANKTNQNRDLELLALNAKDGKLQFATKIGSYTTESNPYMTERTFQPSLVRHGGHLFVDTHSGSLVQFDSASGQVEWGLNYVSEVNQQNRWWGYQSNEPITMGPPQIVDGILYIKGMKSQKLYAVDPQRPKVVWHRPISKVANLIGVDRDHFYLGGDDVSAYDLKSRKIAWSVKVHLGTTWARSVLTENRIFHFSSRGIFEIDKANGKVVRVFRGTDLESLGGTLVVTPKALLTVSNLAITAYPLNADKDVKPAAAILPSDRSVAASTIQK